MATHIQTLHSNFDGQPFPKDGGDFLSVEVWRPADSDVQYLVIITATPWKPNSKGTAKIHATCPELVHVATVDVTSRDQIGDAIDNLHG